MQARAIRTLDRLAAAAARPEDGASGAVFRIAFGLLACYGAVRFFYRGWVDALYVEPAHHFSYLGFEWVQPWPEWGMYLHFALLAALGLGIALGYRYRVCIVLYFLAFTYVELLDQTTYLNHYYWVSLVALLMCFMPLQRTWSLDARRSPEGARGTVPAWALWALRGQIAVVYVFAGIAKLNPDWLLHALPMRIWLHHDADLALIGPLLDAPLTAYAMSWAAPVFELTIVGWLLWRRSQAIAYALLVAFHVLTAVLLPVIGLFPWLMIAATPIFFPPDWPRALARRAAARGVTVPHWLLREPEPGEAERPAGGARRTLAVRTGLLALAVFAMLQLALPLRHYAYPGNVRWNEDGYRFAWRVMLSEKAGTVEFRVHDPASGAGWVVQPDAWYTPLQVRAMSTQPDMILQAAQLIARDFASRGIEVEVRADAFVSFNGRPYARLIDPDADLAAIARRPGPKPWVLSSEEGAAGR